MEIELLTLHTSQLEEMKQFYTKQLGFSLFSEDATHFRIKVGSSLLEFTNEYVVGEPYYHFAFNLPSNQFQEAKTWLKAKTTLLLEDGEDEADFSFWPAHACYFEDPAGNIVELIARYNVNPTSDEPFSVHQILNVSEIGLIVKDAPSVGEQFKKISAYKSDDKPISNDSLSFMKAKDNGVFVLLTGEGRRWLFSEKKSKIFPLRITLRNQYILGVDDRHEFFITKKNDEF
ncbi:MULTISPECIES: VOC family protein [unclassified Virgibacillus]|uniref:VOC family protein n=1 Tax=unclassified Virgibacillus TaxID=2620237 RepID=UPI0024DE1B15|nr:VOC family protein [Virgibacillus sp. LDC-1]